jgi:peptidoglycan/LPS O-acetylase OafA/YrhL
MEGYYIAENSLFENGANKIESFNELKICYILASVFIIVCCFLGRGLIKEILCFNMDFFYAPIVIFVIWQLVSIISNQWISNGLVFLGRYSLEIWFLHAIFFIGNPIVQKIGYWPKVSILILIYVFILLIPFAMIIQKTVVTLLKYAKVGVYSILGRRKGNTRI